MSRMNLLPLSLLSFIFIFYPEVDGQPRDDCTFSPCTPGEKVGDPTNCQKYHECNASGRNWKYPSCSKQLYFDSISGECVREQDATCQGPCGTPVTDPPPVNPCEPLPLPCPAALTVPNPQNCTTFFICRGNNWTEERCRGENYDYIYNKCAQIGASECFPPCPMSPSPPLKTLIPQVTLSPDIISKACNRSSSCLKHESIPDPTDCGNYYICVQNSYTIQSCLNGYVFDALELKCKARNEAACMPACETLLSSTLHTVSTFSTISTSSTVSTLSIVTNQTEQSTQPSTISTPVISTTPAGTNTTTVGRSTTPVVTNTTTVVRTKTPVVTNTTTVVRTTTHCMPPCPITPTTVPVQNNTQSHTTSTSRTTPTTPKTPSTSVLTVTTTVLTVNTTMSSVTTPATVAATRAEQITDKPTAISDVPQGSTLMIDDVTKETSTQSSIIMTSQTKSTMTPTVPVTTTEAPVTTAAPSRGTRSIDTFTSTLTSDAHSTAVFRSTNAISVSGLTDQALTISTMSQTDSFTFDTGNEIITAIRTVPTDFTTSELVPTESAITTSEEIPTESATTAIKPNSTESPTESTPTDTTLQQTETRSLEVATTSLTQQTSESFTKETSESLTSISKSRNEITTITLTTEYPTTAEPDETSTATSTGSTVAAVMETPTVSLPENETTYYETQNSETATVSSDDKFTSFPTSGGSLSEGTTKSEVYHNESTHNIEDITTGLMNTPDEGEPSTKSSTPTITLSTTATTSTLPTFRPSTSPPVTATKYCTEENDRQGLKWMKTAVNKTAELECHFPYEGKLSRRCIWSTGFAKWDNPVNFCVDPSYKNIFDKASVIAPKPGELNTLLDTQNLAAMLREIITNDTATGTGMTPGNVNISIAIAFVLTNMEFNWEYRDTNETTIVIETCDHLTATIDTLLSNNNSLALEKVLEEEKNSAVTIMTVVDRIGETIANTLPPGGSKNTSLQNIAIQAISVTRNHSTPLSFKVEQVDTVPPLVNDSSEGLAPPPVDNIVVQPETLKSISHNVTTGNLVLWTTYYKNIEMYMPVPKNLLINSKVMSLTVQDLSSGYTFHPPVTLQFININKTILINETFCSYWLYTSPHSGYWSSDGCVLKVNTSDLTVCDCNHLTNFAVLISPYVAQGKHAQILSIISLIGCLLSILGYFATIVCYILGWKQIKSQHAIVLLNLCFVLIAANVLFLAGIDKVQYELACTVIAAFLHFIWLVAFMVMLADGVMFILYVVYVFHVKRRRETVGLLLVAWVLPAIIVAVTLGVTKTKGYGTKDYCWLERTSGLIAAFIAPVIIILIANFIVLCKVLHTAATSKSNKQKERSRLLAVLWNIMVVLPLLGIAWIFGLLSVNEQTVAFQYVFAVANSLQGLFIFLFHCALNKKLREAVAQRFSSRGSTTSSLKSAKSNKSDKSDKNRKIRTNRPLVEATPNSKDKAKRSIQRAQKEVLSPTPPRGSLNTNGHAIHGQDNNGFVDDKSFRKRINTYQLSDHIRESIKVDPELIEIEESVPIYSKDVADLEVKGYTNHAYAELPIERL